MSINKNTSEDVSVTEETTASETVSEEKNDKKSKLSDEELAAKAEKKKFSRRRLKYGSAATAVTVIVIVMVVLVNVILGILSERMDMKIDLTKDGTFEISQETIDYLATVKDEIDIVCMSDELTFSTSNYVFYKQAYEVLKKYTIYGDTINLKFVDMEKDPTYANRYSDMYKGEISSYTIVVSNAVNNRIKVISIQDLYNVEMNSYYQQSITSSKAEQELTSAIMYVTDPNPIEAVVFKTESAGTSYDNVYNMLESNGYEVSEIDPIVDEIPETASLIVINAPLNDFSDETVQKIYDFLDNGGKLGRNLIYIADYKQNPTANIDALLSEWGIVIGEGVVGDSNTANTSSQSNYVIGGYIDTNENAYAENVADPTLPVISYYSRPISLTFGSKDTRKTYALMKTEETAFVLTDELQKSLESGEKIDPEYGSFVTAAVASKSVFNSDNEAVYSNVLVFGSSLMLQEQITGATYYANGDYFISAVNTMTGKTAGINIIPKDLKSTTFDMDQKTYNTCFIIFVIVLPLAVLVTGVVVYFRRRHK